MYDTNLGNLPDPALRPAFSHSRTQETQNTMMHKAQYDEEYDVHTTR